MNLLRLTSAVVLATLALEQRRVIPADRRAFLHLAERAGPESAAYFTALAEGETLAAEHLRTFTAACGVDEARADAYEPLPGCQAYPAYVAWLALNANPSDVVLALTANFSAWGGYCATIAKALRTHYGFTDESCAFFDFFAEPAPDLDRMVARLEPTRGDGPVGGQGVQHIRAHLYRIAVRVEVEAFGSDDHFDAGGIAEHLELGPGGAQRLQHHVQLRLGGRARTGFALREVDRRELSQRARRDLGA